MQHRSHGVIQMKGQCRCGNVVGTDVVALIVIVIGGGGQLDALLVGSSH